MFFYRDVEPAGCCRRPQNEEGAEGYEDSFHFSVLLWRRLAFGTKIRAAEFMQ